MLGGVANEGDDHDADEQFGEAQCARGLRYCADQQLAHDCHRRGGREEHQHPSFGIATGRRRGASGRRRHSIQVSVRAQREQKAHTIGAKHCRR